MGLLEIFRPKRYDMDSLEGINAIPVPAKNYNTGDPTKDCIYYVLQRKATEHKKNGHMDLAIACLRKSNELSDYEPKPLLLEKEYLRLVKYLRLCNKNEEALVEEQRIYEKHANFKDARITSKKLITECIERAKKLNSDIIILSGSNSCPNCKRFNNCAYSISGKSKKYYKLPSVFIHSGGYCKEHIMGASIYFESANSPAKKGPRE